MVTHSRTFSFSGIVKKCSSERIQFNIAFQSLCHTITSQKISVNIIIIIMGLDTLPLTLQCHTHCHCGGIIFQRFSNNKLPQILRTFWRFLALLNTKVLRRTVIFIMIHFSLSHFPRLLTPLVLFLGVKKIVITIAFIVWHYCYYCNYNQFYFGLT